MFTGIIEQTGAIKDITVSGTNKSFWVSSPLWNELKIDQSLSHSGVCLTVEEIKDGLHKVTAIEETLLKTTINNWKLGTVVNLERCMAVNGRLDGHIVQGHVDCVATCTGVQDKEGSWKYTFTFPEHFGVLIIEKGSVAVNGTSLTCFNVGKNNFSVAIIPYTYEHTNINTVQEGDTVNIEFDMIGKYAARIAELKTF